MDYGDLENQQFANYLNSQESTSIAQIMRDEINLLNQRRYQQESVQQNINWRIVLAAKELLDDDNTYRLPIGFTFFSLIRIIFTLFALNFSKDRSQFISIFTSVGLFKDLFQIFYNYLLFKQIQKLKKLLYQHQFNDELMSFLNEIQDKDFSNKYKSSLVITCLLNTNSYLRHFEQLVKILSWGLFLYSIPIVALTDLKSDVSGISIPLIVIFTFSNYCIFTVMIAFFFQTVFMNIYLSFRMVYLKIQSIHYKRKMSQLLEKLPCTKYENVKDKENITSCAVCLVDYIPSDKVLQLHCSTQHHFHKVCIQKWLDIKSNCPICRTPVFESTQQLTHQPATSNSTTTSTTNTSFINYANNQNNRNNTIEQEQNINSTQRSQQISISTTNSPNLRPLEIGAALSPESGNNEMRQKSKSESSATTNSKIQKQIQQFKQRQQFLVDLQNSVPNQQLVDMIEENLQQYEQYQLSLSHQDEIEDSLNSKQNLGINASHLE